MEPPREHSEITPRSSSGQTTPIALGAGKKRRVGALAGGLIGLALLGSAGAFAYSKIRASKRTLPVIAAKLPPQTLSITEKRPGQDPLDDVATLPDIYIASAISPMCAGTDVVNLIALARNKDLAWLEKEHLLDLPIFRKGLQCGDKLREGLIAPAITEVRFKDGDKERLVSVIRSRTTEMTSGLGYVRHSFSGLPGFCLKPEAAKEDCPPDANASFKDNDAWFLGRFDAVEPFARSYTTARDELSTTVDILQETIAASEPADFTELVAKPENIAWGMPCALAAPIGKHKEFFEACFPKGQEKLLDAVETKVRGVAVQRDVIARVEGIRFVVTLVARDSDAARDIEKDLLDFTRDWRAQLTNAEPDMSRLLRAKSDFVHDSFWASIYEPFLRALRGVSVTRSGAIVRLQIKETLRPEEAKSLREFTSTQTMDRKAAGEIGEALLSGANLPLKSLGTFVAPEVAKWITAPRATDADCSAITAKMKELLGAATPGSALADYKKTCMGTVMPPDYRACLTGAANFPSFQECHIAWSPWNVEAARKLDGQWEADAVETSGWVEPDVKAALRKAKLEFKDGRLASSIGLFVNEGKANILSEDVGEAKFDVTFAEKSAKVALVWIDPDTFKMKEWLARVESITFKRGKLGESLFVQAKAAAARKAPAYDGCLKECMAHGSSVADCDKQCLAL